MSDQTENLDSAAVQLPSAAEGRWILDPEHSSIRIQHRTMWGLVTVKGAFTSISGEGEIRADGSARGTLSIAAASVDTGNTRRDVHLRHMDFFEAAEHPSIVFTASRAVPDGHGTAKVVGDLTVRGTTRSLAFVARATEATAEAVTLVARVMIDRSAFDMTWNKLGAMRGLTTVTATTRFTRDAA